MFWITDKLALEDVYAAEIFERCETFEDAVEAMYTYSGTVCIVEEYPEPELRWCSDWGEPRDESWLDYSDMLWDDRF